MRTKFYDDMLWSVSPPASCWNYTFQSFPNGNPISRNLCQTLTHVYTQWLPTFPDFPDSQTWTSWYSKEFIFMAMNSILRGRATLLHSFSLLIYTFLSFGTFVCSSVPLCLFLYLCQHCLSRYVINLAQNVQTGAVLYLFSIQAEFYSAFLTVSPFPSQIFSPPCNPVKSLPIRCTKSTIRDHILIPVWSGVSSVSCSESVSSLQSRLLHVFSSHQSERFPVQRACRFSHC